MDDDCGALTDQQGRNARLLTHHVSANGLLGLAAAGYGQALVTESELGSLSGEAAAGLRITVIDRVQAQLEAVWRSQAQSAGLNRFLVLACEFFAFTSRGVSESELGRNLDRSP